MTTLDSSGIVFDAKSGISEEEQREILAKINNIAEKNRLSLSEGGQGKSETPRFKAKKSGVRFPVIVIIIAFAALAGGLTLLSSMQWKTDTQVRTGAKVYNNVERALIEEIRRETQSEASANAAGELERLNREQYQAAAIEDQMGAFFANLNSQITANSLDEAGRTIKSMRDFINTPAFQVLRSIQARKGLYIQAINSFETMVEETRKYQAALNNGAGIPELNTAAADLQAKIAQLEQNLAEKDKTIEAFSSQGSGTARRLNELEKANSALQTRNSQLTADLDRQTQSAASLQQSVNTLQLSERSLQTETVRLNQTVSARENTIQQRDNTIRDLQRQNETQTQRINRIQEVVQGKAAVNMTIGELSESVSRIQEMLGINQ
jgi:uncharacterized protein YoxC